MHSGGFVEGSSRDPRYNLTSIVEQSAKIGKPIIVVSFNYRLLAYGFARSKQILDAGLANLGLKDQRLALHWVQENIAGFGGDPEKVTIWGESAGGFSVGYHLLAYNGRDDKLFRAAISESGQPIGMALLVPTQIEAAFHNFTLRAGCETHLDKLACLRSLSPEKFLAAHNNEASGFWPSVDGDFIARPTLNQLSTGNFVKVPYLAGDNSDEGTAFSPFGVNSDSQLFDVLSQFGLDNATVSELMALYPNNPAQLIPNSHPAQFNSTIGLQWKRIATIVTDALMSVPRKLMIEAMAKKSTAPIYTY
ncbi:Carboxylesterase, type B [Ilyonectria robusta]